MPIDFVKQNLEKFLRSKESDIVSIICNIYPGTKPSEYLGVTNKLLAYRIDRMLALREYNRKEESETNKGEMISANIRALQLMWAGKNADKSIAKPRISEQFIIRDFEEEVVSTSNKDEIPFWADDKRLEEEMNKTLPSKVWDELYMSGAGGLIV